MSTAATRTAVLAGFAAASLAVAAPARAEYVSKLPGASGLPFPAQFIDASTDGRYVLLSVGAAPGVPAAAGPEADLAPLGQYVLRDRVADTTTPLVFRLTPGGAAVQAEPAQVSDDGDRILVRGSDPALATFTGVVGAIAGTPTAVYDRSEDRMLKLPTSPTGPSGGQSSWLSADGTRAVFRTVNNTAGAEVYPVYGGPIGGTGSVVLALPNAWPEGVSADLNTVMYFRTLRPAFRPVTENLRNNQFYAQSYGVKIGAEPPRSIVTAKYNEQRAPGVTECSGDTGVKIEQTSVGIGYLSPDGSRAAWTEASSLDANSIQVRAADGTLTRIPKPNGRDPRITAFGNANQILFNGEGAEEVTFSRELVAGDTELISSAKPTYGSVTSPYATRYVGAESVSGTPTTVPAPPMNVSGAPVDTADRVSPATWYSCPAPPATAPIGTFGQYVDLFLGSSSTRYNIGSATVRFAPSQSLRALSKVTADITVFGASYWKRTLTATGFFNFPKPLWGIPMTLKITVQPVATPGQAAPAPIVKSYPIWTIKTN